MSDLVNIKRLCLVLFVFTWWSSCKRAVGRTWWCPGNGWSSAPPPLWSAWTVVRWAQWVSTVPASPPERLSCTSPGLPGPRCRPAVQQRNICWSPGRRGAAGPPAILGQTGSNEAGISPVIMLLPRWVSLWPYMIYILTSAAVSLTHCRVGYHSKIFRFSYHSSWPC